MTKLGFDEPEWEDAKREGKAILTERAKQKEFIPYSEFVQHIRSIRFEGPHDSRLPHFLAEISKEESQAGRGMLTALVVRKNGECRPGQGFFELAEKLGRNTSDKDKCWIQEVERIFEIWRNQS